MDINKNQIETNLKRTAKKGLISLLDKNEFNKLIKKYYGIQEKNKYIGYIDPYTGKEIRDRKELVLEHIIPISSGGGTVLFNCVPASILSNSTNEKGAKHLIDWWRNSNYYDSNRLIHLLDYIFEAYNQVFNQKDINEVLSSYLNYSDESIIQNLYTDTNLSQYKIDKIKKTTSLPKVKLINYYSFLTDCIKELEKDNINTKKYYQQLNRLKEKGIFSGIELFETYQNILKKIIKNKFDEDGNGRHELTILLNYDILALINSMKELKTYKQIYQELNKRIDNLEKILANHNISINSYFEEIKKSPNLLAKKTEDITNEDIYYLVNNITLNVSDRFNKLCEFIENNNGKNPSEHSENEFEKKLCCFKNSIQSYIKRTNKFGILLSKEQLKYLNNSKYKSLRKIYIIILNRAIKNNIEISYVDKKLAMKIKEYHKKIARAKTREEEIKLEQDYKDYIIIDNKFNEMINFVIKNNGKLPSQASNDESERKLGWFRKDIQAVVKNKYGPSFSTSLSKKDLKYLHDSEYETLKEIYKNILNKAIKNNFTIDYIDKEMELKIKEYYCKKKCITTIEEEIKLEQEYKDYIIIDNNFYKMIDFVIQNNGRLPCISSKNSTEQTLGAFRRNIQSYIKERESFRTSLSRKKLEYLHNSKYKNLREIYKVILNKAIINNTKIDYIDEKMALKIRKYLDKYHKASTLEEKIELEQYYKDYIIIEGNFNAFINFVINNNGQIPQKNTQNEYEKKLAGFKTSIQAIKKDRTKFNTLLKKEELRYLHDSNYNSLKELYKNIIKKANIINYTEYLELDQELNQ